MDTEEKTKIASIHDKELDAPFDTFTYDGLTYHNVGLMQAWIRGYTNPNTHMLDDPPEWTAAFITWLENHNSQIVESFVGPPAVRFPTIDIAQEFKTEWHDKSRERYPYEQTKEFLERNKSSGIKI